jgi:hypothetical protein
MVPHHYHSHAGGWGWILIKIKTETVIKKMNSGGGRVVLG